MIPLPLYPGIQEMHEKIAWIQRNPDLFRAYLRYEKAASDEVTRKGRMEGLQEGRMEEKLGIVSKLKKRGLPVDQIAEVAGLSAEEIATL